MRKRTIDIESSRCECVVNNAISHHFIIGNILQNCLRPVSARTQVVLLVFHLCFAALLQKFIYIFFWSSSNYLSHFVHILQSKSCASAIAIAIAIAIAFVAKAQRRRRDGSFSVCHSQRAFYSHFYFVSFIRIFEFIYFVRYVLLQILSSNGFKRLQFSCFPSRFYTQQINLN